MHQAHIINFGIARPVGEVYTFLADPRNYPKWAAVIESTFRQIGPSEWEAETEFGPRLIRFSARNEFGVLDHAVYRRGDEPLMMPLRVVANGDGCELVFIFYRRPGTTDEQYRSAIEWVTTDFLTLRTLLEALR
jgi:hypothetical protein